MSKSDLEELGESVDDLAQGFSKYAKEIKALTNFDIMADAAKGQFKDIYDIFEGISKVWDKLTDTQQARVSEILGGTRQLQVISSIINNWSDAANAYSTAMNSAGAATKANEIYMETAAAHIERFKAAFQDVSRAVVDTGLLKQIIDFGITLLDIVKWVAQLITKLGGLKTVMLGVSAALLMIKANSIINLFKDFRRWIKNVGDAFSTLRTWVLEYSVAEKAAGASTVSTSAAMQSSIPVIGAVLAAITLLVGGLSLLSSSADELHERMKETADEASRESEEISSQAVSYLQLSEAMSRGEVAASDFWAAKKNLIDLLSEEGVVVDVLTDKYNQNTDAILRNVKEALKLSEIDIRGGLPEFENDLFTAAKEGNGFLRPSTANRIEIKYFDEASVKALKYLKEFIDFSEDPDYSGGYLNFDYDLNTVDGVMEAYENLELMLSRLTEIGETDNNLFRGIFTQYTKLKPAVDAYNSSIAGLNSNLAEQVMIDSLAGKTLPKTQEEFEALRESIIQTASDDSYVNRFIGSQEEIEQAIDDVLALQPEFKQFYEIASKPIPTNNIAQAMQTSADAFRNLPERVSQLKSYYDLLNKAQKETSENGGLSAETIKAFADANKNYLDYLYEENGQIKLNTEAWREFADTEMRVEMEELKVSQQKLKTEREILETKIAQVEAALSDPDISEVNRNGAARTLAILQSQLTQINSTFAENESILLFYETIFNNLTSSTEEVVSYLTSLGNVVNSFEDVANAIKGVNDQYKSLAELQVAVSDGFRMSQEEALKYAEIYPEILSGATLAANGEIQLNENVVNNFIAGKKAELSASIDAQIQRLETRKGVLKAIQDYAIAELEIAQKVASGEALTDKQLSELRAKNKNALTEALIGLNVEEVDANKIAAKAMAGNYGEVDRIEAEVAKNMAENMGKAANDMAVSMHNNMHNAKLDIQSVGKQAFIAAQAINHMKRGVVVDEDNNPVLVSGSSGGAGWAASSSTVSGGTFHGGENIYHEILPELDDYIKGLSDQINSYQDAIDNIDGQIKLLESIKAHAFEIFRKQAEEAAKNKNGTSGSGKNSSSGSDKGDNWFEAQYKLYQHLLKMDAAETEDYLHWLEWAYQEAYNQGIITLDQYFSYQEEVFKGLRDLFKDYLSDLEHQISMRENFDGETDEILKIYEELLAAVTEEIHKAQEQGLDDNDDWLQELQDQYWKYFNAIKDLRDDVTKNAKDSVEELVQIRIKMLKQEIQKEKDAIKERLDALKKFYQKQKDMLQEQYDEEKYLREQSEKRQAVQDIMAELAQLEFDNSAWAEKRKLELRQKLAEAQQDLDDFERDHALETAKDELDKLYEMQEEELENENKLLEEKENDAQALYQQALEDIKNGSIELYEEMIRWNEEYGDGIEDTIKDAWEAAYKALQDYMDLYGEYYNGVHLANATGYQGNGSWDDHFAHTPPSSGSSGNSEAPSPGDTGAGGGGSGSSGSSSPSSSSYPYGKASETTGIIKKGSEGTDVKAIQYALKKLGYKDGNGKVLVIDGKFGAKTEAAVKKFQKKMGLDPNGKVGDKTRKKFKKKGYYTGTSFASPGLHPFEEFGTETTFESNDGTRYKMFTGGEKVLTAKQSDFLYKFATNGARVLEQFMQALTGKGMPNVGQPINHYEIRMGDITINGSANQETVSQMRRAQRESVDFMLKELNKLNAR